MKVLVVEDSPRLRRSLEQGLRREGFTVAVAGDGPEALTQARSDQFDVVVLDLMLPGMSGLDVLRRLRSGGDDVHVLVLSAKDQVADRITGLQSGADDYLVKPFSFDELCARINALVRRRYQAKDPCIAVGSVRIDTASKQVTRGDVPEHLTPSEYSVLEYLAMRRGRVASKDQLMEHLYRTDADVTSNVVEVIVSGLRRKLHVAGEPPIIQTRRGFGYLIE